MESAPSKKARNSVFRKFTDPLTEKVAKGLLKIKPELTADDITRAGLWGVLTGALLTIIPKEVIGIDMSAIALALMTGSTLLDALDGAMARLLKTSSNKGAMLDLMIDRWQETGLAVTRVASASMRRDPIGVLAATFAGITNPLPSYYRAKVEELGYYVPESGAKFTSFLGTRPVRALFGITATAYPEPQLFGAETPLQPILDSVTGLSNVFTAFERASIYRRAVKGSLEQNPDQNAQELGALKAKELPIFMLKNTAIMVAAGTIGLVNAVR